MRIGYKIPPIDTCFELDQLKDSSTLNLDLIIENTGSETPDQLLLKTASSGDEVVVQSMAVFGKNVSAFWRHTANLLEGGISIRCLDERIILEAGSSGLVLRQIIEALASFEAKAHGRKIRQGNQRKGRSYRSGSTEKIMVKAVKDYNNRSVSGETVGQIATRYNISRRTMYTWINKSVKPD